MRRQMMRTAVVSGIGFETCIGNSANEVEKSLRTLTHGFAEVDLLPGIEGGKRLVGRPHGFAFPSPMYLSWKYPAEYKIPREVLRGMNPHGVYAACAALQALHDAGLAASDISDGGTALFAASAGSPWLLSHNIEEMHKAKVLHGSPFGVISGIAGTLNFNLGAFLKIRGANCGFVSACTSSTHALGYAIDEVRLGRHERVIVIGAEDDTPETILPFAAMRALSDSLDPEKASCPFDTARSGFTATGGATALIVESEDAAKSRGAKPYARLLGWAQTADGHSPAQPDPSGEGILRAMQKALADAGISARDIAYINAHATSTPTGDAAEATAITRLLNGTGNSPSVSSTKALTGHGLSLAGAMETAFCSLAMRRGFIPGCAHLRTPCAEAERLNLPHATIDADPAIILKNNSGFGGSNVSLVIGKY
jgi:3-oxoacyl-(acyl-carrier-protein) synthase